jgi:peptidoglycan glycosyltransferase
MFIALMLNMTYAYVFRTDSLNNHPQNRRVTEAEFGTDRGAILVGSTAIATTKPVEDRFRFQRSYPSGALYAPVTGYYSFLYKRSGLEQTQNAHLAGTSNSQFVQRLIDLATGKRPTGASVVTTLDAAAQQAAAKALGDRPGAVVALDYKTGAVKALVTSPTYDPNTLATHDLNAAKASWEALNADAGKPLSNRATREIFPPGSTFKLVVSAAALASGMTPDSLVDSPDSLPLPGTSRPLGNSGNCGGTKISLEQALKVSCNTAFAGLGMKLGADAVRTQAQKFGFGSGNELPDLGSAASNFPAKLDQAQLAQSSIGQYDVAATPLQMAMVGAGIANNGVVMQPYLVSQVRAADLTVLETARPQQFSQAMTAENAQALQRMMVAVVTDGTGTRAQIDGVRVGGKTGTALTDGQHTPYAWFVAWADDPSIAVAVFVQDAGVEASDISGGRYAAPIAKSVIEALR